MVLLMYGCRGLSVILGHMTVNILIGAGVVFLPDEVINSEEENLADLPSS